jgi:hypothetical protein
MKSRSQEPEFRIQNDNAETTLTDFLFFWLLTSGFCLSLDPEANESAFD